MNKIPFELPSPTGPIRGTLDKVFPAWPPKHFHIYVDNYYWGMFHEMMDGWHCDGVGIERYMKDNPNPTDYFFNLIQLALDSAEAPEYVRL